MKHYNIQIPDPCSQSWEAMSIQQNGRFCSSCEKVIRDYSQVSDSQLQYILDHSNGEVCGRFSVDQLNRPLMKSSHTHGPDLLAVVLGMTLLMTTYSAQATEIRQVIPEISLIQMLEDTSKLDQGHESVIVKFQLLDQQSYEPIPFVRVKISGENGVAMPYAMSDFDGNVKIQLSPDQYDAADSILFNSFEYTDVSIPWNPKWKDLQRNEILMYPEWREVVVMMGAVSFDDGRSKREIRKQNRREKRRLRKED